jgi:uncharacterized protein (DUF488 family)
MEEAKMDLFTIGYEGLSEQVFLALLQNDNISLVADIRRLPLSRKRGFSKSALNKTLSDNDINYLNYPELGTSKKLRNHLKETGDYSYFFKEYKKDIANKDEYLDEINDMIYSGERIALLCFERDAQSCHRKILADSLKKRDGNGMKIKHIAPI